MARQLLVTALENPSRDELIQDLYELTVISDVLRQEVHTLHHEIASLKGALAGCLNLFLTTIGVSEQDVEQLMNDLFKSEED